MATEGNPAISQLERKVAAYKNLLESKQCTDLDQLNKNLRAHAKTYSTFLTSPTDTNIRYKTQRRLIALAEAKTKNDLAEVSKRQKELFQNFLDIKADEQLISKSKEQETLYQWYLLKAKLISKQISPKKAKEKNQQKSTTTKILRNVVNVWAFVKKLSYLFVNLAVEPLSNIDSKYISFGGYFFENTVDSSLDVNDARKSQATPQRKTKMITGSLNAGIAVACCVILLEVSKTCASIVYLNAISSLLYLYLQSYIYHNKRLELEKIKHEINDVDELSNDPLYDVKKTQKNDKLIAIEKQLVDEKNKIKSQVLTSVLSLVASLLFVAALFTGPGMIIAASLLWATRTMFEASYLFHASRTKMDTLNKDITGLEAIYKNKDTSPANKELTLLEIEKKLNEIENEKKIKFNRKNTLAIRICTSVGAILFCLSVFFPPLLIVSSAILMIGATIRILDKLGYAESMRQYFYPKQTASDLDSEMKSSIMIEKSDMSQEPLSPVKDINPDLSMITPFYSFAHSFVHKETTAHKKYNDSASYPALGPNHAPSAAHFTQ